MAEFLIEGVQIRGRDVVEVTRAVIDVLDFPKEAVIYPDRTIKELNLPDIAYIYHPRNTSRPVINSALRTITQTHPDAVVFCPVDWIRVPGVNLLGLTTRPIEGHLYTVNVDSPNVASYYQEPLRKKLTSLDRKPMTEVLMDILINFGMGMNYYDRIYPPKHG